jgi:hypothetical protein
LSGTIVWQPIMFCSHIRTVTSSSLTAIINTDAGLADLKAINNPQGQHVLPCDWFGIKLAERFGLPVFDVAILKLTNEDEIEMSPEVFAQPGPSFVAQSEIGVTMTKFVIA